MAQSSTNPKVDPYFTKAKKWGEELARLRGIILSCPVAEELKWGKPCYTAEEANVVLLIGFKDYCSLLFPKGALLKDAKKLLTRPSENTQAARQMRFTSMAQLEKQAAAVKAYVKEAIAVEKAGREVTFKKITDHKMPAELEKRLKADAALKKAFAALTPGRQRAYYLHFSGAKQAATREARIEKCVPLILAGKGLNDEYKAGKK